MPVGIDLATCCYIGVVYRDPQNIDGNSCDFHGILLSLLLPTLSIVYTSLRHRLDTQSMRFRAFYAILYGAYPLGEASSYRGHDAWGALHDVKIRRMLPWLPRLIT